VYVCRIYCSLASDAARCSAQSVQFHLLDALTTVLSPIVPHLCEEAYQYHPLSLCESHQSWQHRSVADFNFTLAEFCTPPFKKLMELLFSKFYSINAVGFLWFIALIFVNRRIVCCLPGNNTEMLLPLKITNVSTTSGNLLEVEFAIAAGNLLEFS